MQREVSAMKRNSPIVFIAGMVLTLAVAIPVLYFLLSAPLIFIVLTSVFIIFLWGNGFRMFRQSGNSSQSSPNPKKRDSN